MISSSNVSTDAIQIDGLCTDIKGVTEVISQYPYWFENIINETLKVPDEQPDIESINSLNITVNILQQKVVKTPIATTENIEGKMLSGRKLIVEGNICQKLSYTASEYVQGVYSVDYYVPFSVYIVVPKEYTFNSVVLDSLDINYSVNACVEDVSLALIDSRTIKKEVTFLLYAVPKQI